MRIIINELTRECLAIDVARRANNQNVLAVLTDLMVRRGVPDRIQSDNSPEFPAITVREWINKIGAKTLFIEPDCPWENDYNGNFSGKLRDEFLNVELFDTLQEAEVLIGRWRRLAATDESPGPRQDRCRHRTVSAEPATTRSTP